MLPVTHVKHHLYLLTGASRGLGLAMAEQLLCADHLVLCISRRTNKALASRAATLDCQLEQWAQDLEHSVEAAQHLSQWLGSHQTGLFASATLINNAGSIPGIGPLSAADPIGLSRALRVGLETPMLLSAAFLRATQAWNIPRKVLNISSGLGRRAMASQATYCAAKAGMDHFTRCLALEEALKPQGAKVCSLAPGVIDTDMQLQLRDADASAFPDQQNFIDLKIKDRLSSPADAASQVLAYLAQAEFGSNPIGDVRD
jgi:NAD(P)-dependent dehydrogenase (short-subunit alcohol dehydrogenase family)